MEFVKLDKEFVDKEMRNLSGAGRKITPSDDGLGFVMEIKNDEKDSFLFPCCIIADALLMQQQVG